jgi:hypothetical protein
MKKMEFTKKFITGTLLAGILSTGCTTGQKAVGIGVFIPVVGVAYYGIKKHDERKEKEQSIKQEELELKKREIELKEAGK